MGLRRSSGRMVSDLLNLFFKLGLPSSDKTAASSPRVKDLLNNEAKHDLSSLLYIHSYLRDLLPMADIHPLPGRGV